MKLNELKVKHKTLAEEAKIIRLERRKNRARARNIKYQFTEKEDKLKKKYRDVLKSIPITAERQRWLDELDETHSSLTDHLKQVVSREARATHIAYGLMKGLDYHQIENKFRRDNFPDWKRVNRILKSFKGHNEILANISHIIERHEQIKNERKNLQRNKEAREKVEALIDNSAL